MYESVSDFNNDEPGRLLFAAVSYMYMYTCTSACNIIRERGGRGRGKGGKGGRGGREGGREGGRGRELNNITAFIRHSTDPMGIENRGYKTMSSKILQNC